MGVQHNSEERENVAKIVFGECVGMKDISAGLVAGLIVGFLSVPMWFFIEFLVLAGRVRFEDMFIVPSETPFARQMGLPPEIFMVFFVVGLVGVGAVYAGLGAVLGIAFAKFRNNLPFSSPHLNTLSLGFFLCLVISLVRAVSRQPLDIILLMTIVIDSQIFSLLFSLLKINRGVPKSTTMSK